jgi:2-deoxy-D-gluconate 3-dehydrogenase
MAGQPLEQLIRLDGKRVIVTGGAKGIGRGIVERFAEAGATVVVSDIDADAGASLAEAVKGEFIRADMTREDELVELVRQVDERLGGAQVLVNNAGIYPFKPVLDMTAEEWDRVQNVNMRGLFILSREFARSAARRGEGGAIVNIGSIDSLHPSSVGLAAYDASKGAVLMFTKNFALEAAPLGIRVNMIAPGGITTEGVSASQGNVPPDMLQQFLARVPMGRWGVPDDIATMALVLATPLSAYMTGATVVVDGGRLLS